ncbi:response regulator [Motiliproteus sp. MSK22-1]|uniref:response regulator n=1 Tax=Motiliproteus sp. MSK22-1 TaxID=1897630 RepID=UPI0009775B5A|nr:response regulator [Motiliproteus sp. MSK22-1]OMH32682.1 hypothetical protein BGP75_14155 [Motiliproteus sp. MSK22-1]
MKQPKKVLIVDDERLNCKLMAEIVTREGYDYQCASDGLEALTKMEEYKADLLLVDMMMPGMDGIELTRRLKADKNTCNVPVILVTGMKDQDSRLKGLGAGAEDFLNKPVDRTELSIRVRNLLRLKELIDQSTARSNVLEKEAIETAEELADARQQLLHSEKMAAIGQLAAGVAHEINNPVGYISSNINSMDEYAKDLLRLLEAYESVEKLLPEDDAGTQLISRLKEEVDIEYLREDVQHLLDESKQGVERVKSIVHDLKYFAHPDKGDWQWSNLHDGLNSTINVVWNEVKYKADVNKSYGELPEILCLPSQLNQIWMNFLVNAAHAIEGMGVIHIRTGMDGDDHVWVEVEDNGQGMPPSVQKKVFEPFFTTKPPGKGTGLGLSISLGVIEKHGGQVDIDSELGRGTRLRVTLPVSRSEPVPNAEPVLNSVPVQDQESVQG